MIDIDVTTHSLLYTDYQECLRFLGEIKEEDYEYPTDVTNFHVYTEVRSDKELECIKSFLATQNLDKTRLIVWSDYSIEDNPLIQPYKKYLDLRVWNAREEAKGTPLENELSKLDAADNKHYLQSDLLRILVLYKYGGVWVDMDIVFLRDFVPILDQEYMYQWGSGIEYGSIGACATVLSAKKKSKFATDLIESLKTMPIVGGTTIWGKDMFAKMWREGKRFNVLPSSFFNTEWMIGIKDVQLSSKLQSEWFLSGDLNMQDYLFLEAFAWHWHNSSNKYHPIRPGSKFQLLRERTDSLLRERGIL